MKNYIFVQIAAYRDPELLPTIRDCIKKAKFPERLTFGLCWQRAEEDSLEEFTDAPNFKVLDFKWEDSKGLCWARSLIQPLWAGEEYTLQLDSHHRFAQDWDEELINMIIQLQENGSPKPILGSYAGMYQPANDKLLNIDPYQMVPDDFTPGGTILFRPSSIPNWEKLTAPIRARFVSGHYFFTIGQHCEEYKYDPNIYFAGDEISLSIRSFTLGYDLFHPHKTLVWHEYTREGRTKHWSDHDQKLKQENKTELTWWERDTQSKTRLRHMLQEEDNNIDLTIYGLGSARTHREYELYAGIDFKGRRLQEQAIRGVEPPCSYVNDAQWEAGFVKEHMLTIKWDSAKIDKCDDYQFWYFGIEDALGNVIYRKDIDQNTVGNYFNSSKNFMQVKFKACNKPKVAIIWPVSKSKGWLTKVEIPL
jgi:hypothetical protein